MATKVKLVVSNATVTQNEIVEVEVVEVSPDDLYRIEVNEPRSGVGSYLAVDGDTVTDIASDLASDLNAAPGLTVSNSSGVVSIEAAGAKPILLSTTRWMEVTVVQEASVEQDVKLSKFRGKTVAAGGTVTIDTELETIEENGQLASLEALERRGLINLQILNLNEGEIADAATFSGDADLDDLALKSDFNVTAGDVGMRASTIDGNVDLAGGGTVTMSDVVIRGDLVVDATTNIDFASVEVVGDVNLASGAGTVSWKGGAFHGTATDPGAKLGGAASGSYLSV